MSSNRAIDDIKQLFDLGGKETDDSNDYSSTDSDDSAKPQFDELLSDLGDRLEVEGKSTPEIVSTKPIVEEKPEVVATPAAPVAPPEATKKIEPKVEKQEKVEKMAEKPVKEEPKTNIVQKSSEELIRESAAISADEEEVNIDADDIFASAPSRKKEPEVEVSNSKDTCVEVLPAEAQDESPEAVDAEVTKTPEKVDTTGLPPVEPIPFDLPVTEEANERPLNEVQVTGVKAKNNVRIVNGNIQWLTKSPSDKYNIFYESKVEMLDTVLPDGQVPFLKYKQELRGAHVDTQVPSMDPNEILSRMQEVQQWRERISEGMAMHVNEHYYIWKRYIELIRGQLARTECEKPASRQEGVVFQHLRDFEFYFAELEHLHNHISIVMKNLDSSWETLNRQVTVAQAARENSARDAVRYVRTNQLQGIQEVAVNVVNKPQTSLKENKQEVSISEPKSQSTNVVLDDLLGELDGIEGESVTAPQKQSGSKLMEWSDF